MVMGVEVVHQGQQLPELFRLAFDLESQAAGVEGVDQAHRPGDQSPGPSGGSLPCPLYIFSLR